MTKKKLMMAGLSAGLVAVVGVGGTLAYLSAQSDVVTNTFAVGSGFIPGPDGELPIVLDEALVDAETGIPVEPEQRVDGNEYENLLPNDVRTKDPTVHLTGGSVDGYVFVRIEGWDQFEDNIEVLGYDSQTWIKVKDTNGSHDGMYLYAGEKTGEGEEEYVVDLDSKAVGTWVNLEPVFTQIKVNKDITQDELKTLNFDDMTLKAVVVQADNMTVEEAGAEAEEILAK